MVARLTCRQAIILECIMQVMKAHDLLSHLGDEGGGNGGRGASGRERSALSGEAPSIPSNTACTLSHMPSTPHNTSKTLTHMPSTPNHTPSTLTHKAQTLYLNPATLHLNR